MKLYLKCLTDYAKFIYKEDNSARLERGDSGYDVFCMDDIIVPPRSTVKVSLGIAVAPDQKHGYYLYPRSSISKTQLRLANSVGIIDAGYRGEICAMVDNITDTEAQITKGQRLFQLCAPDLKPIIIEFVDNLDDTERGTGGFGSTGSI